MKQLLLIFSVLSLTIVSADAQKINIVTEEWPPYNYTENGKVIGVTTDIVKAVLDRAGIDAKIRVYPWARAYSIASENENTLIYTILRLPEREKLFKWIKLEGLSINMYLYRHKSRSDIAVKSLEDVKKYRVGVTRQTSTHVFLLSQGFKEGVNLLPVNSEMQNALMADPTLKRIDFTTGDKLSLAMWLKKAGLPPDYWKEEVFLFKEDFYMAFGKKTPDALVERMKTAFGQIREEGKFDAIIEAYTKKFQLR